MAAANNLLREGESCGKSQGSSPSQPCRAAWDVTRIIFSDTHAGDDRKDDAMPNPAAKHTDEFRRETADCTISAGRPIEQCCSDQELRQACVDRAHRGTLQPPQAPLDDRLQGAGKGYGGFLRTHGAQARRASHGDLIPRARVSKILAQATPLILHLVTQSQGESLN